MDFIDELKQFSFKISKIRTQIGTEEATKMSLVVPFFQILGYDVFNPEEFMPEFTADVGLKKGEKVDYAILNDGKPVLLIEAKWCGANLDNHSSQLFRYFATTSAKFGILTNGIIYKFFTDLDEPNKMDLSPFLEFDFSNLKDSLVPEIKKFHKSGFDVEKVFSTAAELKYTKLIQDFMGEQLKSPSDTFVRIVIADFYSGSKTQGVLDKFKPIVKKAINNYISELMSEKITSALKKHSELENETERQANDDASVHEEINELTDMEQDALSSVRELLGKSVSKQEVTYRKRKWHFSILYQNNARKWICHLILDKPEQYLILPNEDKSWNSILLQGGIDDLRTHKDALKKALSRYLN